MFSCDYTNSTDYKFNTELCDRCSTATSTGECCDPNKINNSRFRCGTNSNKWVQIFIPEIIDIPTEKPSIESLTSVNTSVDIISQRVIKTPTVSGFTNPDGTVVPGNTIPNAECTLLTGKKLIIEGIIRQKVIYTALLENQALHSATFEIPFSTFIIVDADTPLSYTFNVETLVEDVFACQLSERSVFSNSTIYIRAAEVC